MNTFEAVQICEGGDVPDHLSDIGGDAGVEAWQHLIDTGLAWTLQGAFGRQAQRLIEAGICHE